MQVTLCVADLHLLLPPIQCMHMGILTVASNNGELSLFYTDGWHQNDGEPSLHFTCVCPNQPPTAHQTKAYPPWPPQHIQY